MDRTQAQKLLTKVDAKLEQRKIPVRKDYDSLRAPTRCGPTTNAGC
jgi:hypothetical protein